MDVESLKTYLILQDMTDEQQETILSSVRAANEKAKQLKKERISQNVGLVVDALKKIEADIRARYDDLGGKIESRVNSIRDGRDGADGRDGKDGQNGRDGKDGAPGPMGPAGRDGRDGLDGQDGVSVIDAKIDFDGSLVISLSNGREINVGEVVAPDLAERIKVITNGGGTSQTVLDALASLQAQIDALVILDYKGTWNASTNTPTLASSVGTSGDYYIVSTAGTTDLNGITDWQPGDWLIFNGTVWQKIDQSWATAGVNNNITSMTGITGGISSPDFIQFDTAYATTLTAGQLGWDGNNTLGLGMAGGNVVQHIGEDQFFYCKASSSITKGQVVMFTGAVGASGVPTGAPATGVTDGTYIMGIAAESIALNGFGLVQSFGTLRNVNTSGYADGDILWYDPSVTGGLTKTKPSAPNVKVQMAAVINGGSSGGGTILIRIDAGSVLGGTDSNVGFGTLADKNLIQYDSALGYWKNVAPSAVTGVGSVANALTIGTGLSGTSYNGSSAVTITNTAPDQVVSLTGAGTTAVTGTYPNFTITSNDQYTGTVTSVGGTGTVNGISLSGTVTSSGSLTLGGALTGTASLNINGSVGATTPSTGAFTNLSYTGTLTGSTGVINIGSGQVYKDASGNVGVGTSSPSNKLSVSNGGANGVEVSVGASISNILSFNRSTSVYTDFGFNAQTFTFATGTGSSSSERMRIDSSGRVGIATTPYAWALAANLDVGPVGINGNGADAYFSANQYYDGAWKYKVNGFGTVLLQTNGNFDFYNAPSGTAGAASTQTLRMRLDPSGNLGIGTSSPNQSLMVYRASGAAISLNNAATGTAAASGFQLQGGSAGDAYIWNYSNSFIAIGTNNTERARIDSSGNLLVGTTSAGGVGFSVFGQFPGVIYQNNNAAGSGFAFTVFQRSGSTVGSITQNGTTAVAYNTSSDYRLKENIQPMTGALAKVALLKPCTYKWKADGSDGEGFIAHELAEVVPQCVTGEKDAVGADGNPVYQGIDTSFLVATLTAALQEAHGLIKDLQARVDALEAK